MIGYEWTSNAGGGDNLHRNVIYRDGASFRPSMMIPFTTFQSEDAGESYGPGWQAYEQKTGGKVLAIPHNGNLVQRPDVRGTAVRRHGDDGGLCQEPASVGNAFSNLPR